MPIENINWNVKLFQMMCNRRDTMVVCMVFLFFGALKSYEHTKSMDSEHRENTKQDEGEKNIEMLSSHQNTGSIDSLCLHAHLNY